MTSSGGGGLPRRSQLEPSVPSPNPSVLFIDGLDFPQRCLAVKVERSRAKEGGRGGRIQKVASTPCSVAFGAEGGIRWPASHLFCRLSDGRLPFSLSLFPPNQDLSLLWTLRIPGQGPAGQGRWRGRAGGCFSALTADGQGREDAWTGFALPPPPPSRLDGRNIWGGAFSPKRGEQRRGFWRRPYTHTHTHTRHGRGGPSAPKSLHFFGGGRFRAPTGSLDGEERRPPASCLLSFGQRRRAKRPTP